MALSGSTIWEVRNGAGNDTNGGGFVSGATGTDYSQQNTANSAGNNISTTDAVANGTTTITSATASFTNAIVGNIIYFTGGSGSIAAQWRQVTGFTNATTITIDLLIAASTGMTMNIGGALNTISQALTNMVANNTIYVKATQTYSISVALTTGTAGGAVNGSQLIGYNTTRGDNGQVTIQATAAFTMYSPPSWFTIRNFIWDANLTATNCVIATGNDFFAANCVFKNFTARGLQCNGTAKVFNCIATGGKTGATGGIYCNAIGQTYIGCVCYANSGDGFNNNGNVATYINCISFSNTGNGYNNVGRSVVINCVAYSNTSNGFNGQPINPLYINNILESNSAWGIASSGTTPVFEDFNAFYNNTSGTVQNGSLIGTHSLNAGADVFVNAASQNFALNNNNPGGALLRAVGYLGTFTGISTTGYQDIGTTQHQDSGGSPVNVFVIGD